VMYCWFRHERAFERSFPKAKNMFFALLPTVVWKAQRLAIIA
jgi:hypothetical protein